MVRPRKSSCFYDGIFWIIYVSATAEAHLLLKYSALSLKIDTDLLMKSVSIDGKMLVGQIANLLAFLI